MSETWQNSLLNAPTKSPLNELNTPGKGLIETDQSLIYTASDFKAFVTPPPGTTTGANAGEKAEDPTPAINGALAMSWTPLGGFTQYSSGFGDGTIIGVPNGFYFETDFGRPSDASPSGQINFLGLKGQLGLLIFGGGLLPTLVNPSYQTFLLNRFSAYYYHPDAEFTNSFPSGVFGNVTTAIRTRFKFNRTLSYWLCQADLYAVNNNGLPVSNQGLLAFTTKLAAFPDSYQSFNALALTNFKLSAAPTVLGANGWVEIPMPVPTKPDFNTGLTGRIIFAVPEWPQWQMGSTHGHKLGPTPSDWSAFTGITL